MNDSGYQILCIDKDPESCREVMSMLRNSGKNYSFNECSDANEALNLIEDQSFDLYLIDALLFEDISGVELCRRIRLSDAETPILFFDTVNDNFLQFDALKFGANECLVKPSEFNKLTGKVEQLLAEKQIWDEMKLELSYGNDKPARIFTFM